MTKGKLWVVLISFLALVGAMWGSILAMGMRPNLGLDLQGGVSITLAPEPGQEVDEEILEQTVTVIRQRVDALGVAEPDIARQGENILVQLPGAADQAEAEEVVGRTAQLQFRPVLDIIAPDDPRYADTPDCDALLAELTGPADPSRPVVLCESPLGAGEEAELEEETEQEIPVAERVKYQLAEAVVVGADVEDARAAPDQVTGLQWQVNLTLSREGGDRFQETTAQLACEPPGAPQRRFAIILDNTVDSAPQVSEQVPCGQGIGREAQITVGGGEEEARDLALLLRAGALPIQLEVATSQNVSPTLGVASLRAGLLAGLIGLLLVAVYLIVLYRGIGVAAVAELAMFGLVVYGAIVLLGEFVGFTLTLAGIAGIIVSIGIAADSSIIYRERYRDEIRAGRTVRTAAEHAFSKAWRTNLTGNTVSFLAAVVLYYLAIGPVRGFAFTLGLSTLIDTILFGTFTRSLFGLVARNPKLAKSPWVGLRAQEVAPDAVGATKRDPRRKAKV
ncbi:MAG TPA: protein translocase subunit SecD [Egibacteraceae bacterium]|nr:protein translocase subunit SecD [Egibacteraceae bacterium]